jgi:NitT/TauT family transport system permease protein
MLRRSRFIALLGRPLQNLWQDMERLLASEPKTAIPKTSPLQKKCLDRCWLACLILLIGLALWSMLHFICHHLEFGEIKTVMALGLLTMLRVFVMLLLPSAIWVPVGVLVGMRPNLATNIQPLIQFLSAFPANLLFPLVVSAIIAFQLNPELWLTPLLILGAQWYILFNVIAGASTIPLELKDAGRNLHLGGWLWWRTLSLPAIFPFYITGVITAAGGAWNASIVAEIVSWGNSTLAAHGLGAYIVMASQKGDFDRLILGIATMSFFVVLINRILWRPLFAYASRHFQLS